ncbi:hypothetical protein FGIG_09699 [Fasciola gigantica]|uniref:Uncharacterized protein n=1 Tax=Fasciola gigantica TaxID=46835 RepID=A0A504YRL4_FASGI|nr:hypothetical protein FGIG_09699 [Fasciola gigantica]
MSFRPLTDAHHLNDPATPNPPFKQTYYFSLPHPPPPPISFLAFHALLPRVIHQEEHIEAAGPQVGNALEHSCDLLKDTLLNTPLLTPLTAGSASLAHLFPDPSAVEKPGWHLWRGLFILDRFPASLYQFKCSISHSRSRPPMQEECPIRHPLTGKRISCQQFAAPLGSSDHVTHQNVPSGLHPQHDDFVNLLLKIYCCASSATYLIPSHAHHSQLVFVNPDVGFV